MHTIASHMMMYLIQYRWVMLVMHPIFTIAAYFEAGPVTALFTFIMYFMVVGHAKAAFEDFAIKAQMIERLKNTDISEMIDKLKEQQNNNTSH